MGHKAVVEYFLWISMLLRFNRKFMRWPTDRNTHTDVLVETPDKQDNATQVSQTSK